MDKESSYKKISELVNRFEEHKESYKNSDYNETQTRRDFIDPFFKAIGWDIDNEQGLAEAYREVIHEDKLKIDESTKAPDYCFTIYGQKKFYVEAKKPSVEIKDANAPAYQIRRYGWSAKLPISILTDFQEFAIYDCIKKPIPTDKPAVSRIKYLTYKEYLTEFDFLYDTFSKENILKGSFDKFVASSINKKGTSSVDSEFLKSMEEWRKSFALNIALRNDTLNEDEMNFTVQQTIDRLIFLRICEDRKIEPYGTLKSFIDADSIYEKLFKYFQRADDKYNSGLFDFKKDKISQKLIIDNKILKSIITEMYYPICPYEFSVIPVEILGNSYEQFLGSVIRLTDGHHAKVEVKPEVRKAGGVYYTPQYIVEYIVKNTVEKLIENKTPAEISKIKILDPACGSGSFLLGAYQHLLNYHLNYYLTKSAAGKKEVKNNPLTPDGRLSTAEKKRILINNIFGVDIDTQAVEVTKLSLLLKCLEGETEASVNEQLSLFHERVLPNLENNIKSGNSLIDFDFYEGELDFTPQEDKKVKPFNWEKAFPDVFKQGGFNVVIGNPPYLGGREWKEENGNQYNYFIKKYIVAEYQFDIYALFWEQGIKLLKINGYIGFITPNTWLNNQSNTKLRTYMLNNTNIFQVIDYSKIRVFDQAVVLPVVTILKNSKEIDWFVEVYEPDNNQIILKNKLLQSTWLDGEYNIINIDLKQEDISIRSKIENNSKKLEDYGSVKFGIKLYETGKGNPPQKAADAKGKIFESNKKIDKTYRPYLEGKDINYYSIEYKNRWLKYGNNLAAPRDPLLFEGERLLIRRIVGEKLICAYTNDDFVTSQLLQIFKPSEPDLTKYILAILNSRLMAYYFRKKYNRQDKTFPEIRIYELASLPIHTIDSSDSSIHMEITKLVDSILSLNKELQKAKLPQEQDKYKNRIDYSDKKIDELVYKLYGLSPNEIKIVEGVS